MICLSFSSENSNPGELLVTQKKNQETITNFGRDWKQYLPANEKENVNKHLSQHIVNENDTNLNIIHYII